MTAFKVRGFDVEIMGQLDFFFWVRGCDDITDFMGEGLLGDYGVVMMRLRDNSTRSFMSFRSLKSLKCLYSQLKK